MKLTTKRKEQISSVLIICLGNILNAFSARVFLLPADLVAGGTTGIGLILQRITGIPLSSLVLAFNIIMLVLAYIFLGKKYTLSAILSSFMYPIALEFFNQILGDYVLTDNLILCTLFAGFLFQPDCTSLTSLSSWGRHFISQLTRYYMRFCM